MSNDILVVEANNGKIKHKYISKKSAKKHMSERHERLDNEGLKKKGQKIMVERFDRDGLKKSTKKSSKKSTKKSTKKSSKKSTKKSTKKLVVMAKNNKPSYKYMSEKEINKHFEERHKRND